MGVFTDELEFCLTKMSSVQCAYCQLLNWSTAKSCERCKSLLIGLPRYEYPPLSAKEPPDWFWEVIAQAQKSPAKLHKLLLKRSEDEIYKFQGEFIQAAADLRDNPFIEFMEQSEDGVEDISLWVVSQGKEYYLNVVRNPESIPYSSENDINSNEILIHVAYDVFEEKFKQKLNLMW